MQSLLHLLLLVLLPWLSYLLSALRGLLQIAGDLLLLHAAAPGTTQAAVVIQAQQHRRYNIKLSTHMHAPGRSSKVPLHKSTLQNQSLGAQNSGGGPRQAFNMTADVAIAQFTSYML